MIAGRTARVVILVCAGLLATAIHAQRAPARFERVISPFVVEKEPGQPYALPFLGGFDVPRPQFADIDADGDHDLFVQEYPNAVAFFRPGCEK